jgi:hypothetical protein
MKDTSGREWHKRKIEFGVRTTPKYRRCSSVLGTTVHGSRGINTTVSMKDLGDLVAYYT